MGNPAGVRAKKRAKRRKRYEQRLGIGRYAPEQPKEKQPRQGGGDQPAGQ